MKNSLKILFSFAGLALLATPVLRADDPAPPSDTPPPSTAPGHHGQMRDRFQAMVKQLNLTADQKSKIGAIFEQSAQAMKALHEDTSLSAEDKHAKMKELRQGTEQQVHALLTPDQLAQLKQLRQQHQQQGNNPPPAPPAPGI
jgi:periplasmic protein CpxP/Spy